MLSLEIYYHGQLKKKTPKHQQLPNFQPKTYPSTKKSLTS